MEHTVKGAFVGFLVGTVWCLVMWGFICYSWMSRLDAEVLTLRENTAKLQAQVHVMELEADRRRTGR